MSGSTQEWLRGKHAERVENLQGLSTREREELLQVQRDAEEELRGFRVNRDAVEARRRKREADCKAKWAERREELEGEIETLEMTLEQNAMKALLGKASS